MSPLRPSETKVKYFLYFYDVLGLLDPHYIHLGRQIAQGTVQMKFEQEGVFKHTNCPVVEHSQQEVEGPHDNHEDGE